MLLWQRKNGNTFARKMKNIKEQIQKLFEAVDPEGQLDKVKQDMMDAVDSAIQDQSTEKDEQIKALESEIEQLKKQVSPESREQAKQYVDEIKSQAKEAEETVVSQKLEIDQLKQEVEQTKQKLQNLQKSAVQQIDAQIEAAKQLQQEKDAQIAIEQTKQMLQAIDAKAQQDKDNLVESVSDFLDTFLDSKTNLNAAINATAMLEAYKEAFTKIRDVLFEEKMFESGVKAKADALIKEAKGSMNAQLNEAIEVNRKNNELQKEIDALKGKIYLAEKVKFLKPSVAEEITELLEGKSVEQIDKEFDKIQQQIEKNEEEHKKLLRERARLQQNKLDKSLQQEDGDSMFANKNQKIQQGEKNPVATAFAQLIKVRKI